MLQEIGFFQGGFNYPLWYYSVLIVGGYFLYYIISGFKSGTEFIVPLLCLVSFVFVKYLSGTKLEIWSIHGGIYVPLLRGVADMCVGIITRGLIQNQYSRIYSSKFLDFVLILSFILTWCIMMLDDISDFYILLTVPTMIFISLRNKGFIYKVFKSKVWDKLGRVTWEMFLLHGIIISVFNKIVYILGLDKNILVFTALVILVTGISFAYKSVCTRLNKLVSSSN